MNKWIRENLDFMPLIAIVIVIALLATCCFCFKKEKLQKVEKLELNIKVENGMNIEMNASGYAIGSPYNSITKSGNPVISLGYIKIGNENIFTVASDKRILPLGSLIYIDSLGIGMVQDTGTEINGNDIDICFQTQNQAIQFGKKKVKVIILRKGIAGEIE